MNRAPLFHLIAPLLFFLTVAPSPSFAAAEKPAAEQTGERERPRLILVSWDGAGDVLMDRLLAEGRLPNLARLKARGAAAEHMIGTWPTKTAPSHASIYTGCGPGVHGVTANSVAYVDEKSSRRVNERYNGFSSLALRAEPLFVTSTVEGLDTAVLAATHYNPHAPVAERFTDARAAGKTLGEYRSFSSFDDKILPAGTLASGDLEPASGWTDLPARVETTPTRQFHFVAADHTFYGLLYDDPEDPVKGLDSLLVRQDSKGTGATTEQILKPSPADPERPHGWSRAFVVENAVKRYRAHLFLRLFELSADGSSFTLYRRGTNHAASVVDADEREAYLNAGAASYDDPTRVYRFGRLGRPLMIGGDGRAERRLLEAYAFDIDLLIAGFRHAWEHWKPDVLFHYSPALDQLGHTLQAAVEPDSESYDPDVAPKIWQIYVQLATHLDRWLGVMMELAEDETVIAVVSDHGMAFSNRDVAVNRIMEEAGLLARDDSGRIDLSRTKILNADAAFFLRVNEQAFKGGIVAPEERRRVVRQAAAALLAARDPENGAPIFSQVFEAESLSHLGLGRYGGDLFIDTMPGYYPVFGFPKSIVRPSRAPWGSGTHGHWRQRRDMHAIFYVAGPGVAQGVTLPPMEQIDVAPTLAKLIGLRAPADACGRVLHEAIADPATEAAP